MRKDWRTRRLSRRHLYTFGALLILLPLVFASQAAADHVTLANPPSFTYKSDESCSKPVNLLCPDDQPGQKDLSSHAVATPSPGDLWVSWKWDVTSLSGGNTGDACALFDTDTSGAGLGRVDFAICVTIGENPAVQLATSPRVYTCGDGKVDRCTSTITQQQNIHSVCGVSRPASSDPFHTGEADTVAVCHVALADVGGAGTTNLVNTCSYPSEQPNSDPSDCVLIARDAFIRIQKIIDTSASATFNFNVTPLPGGVASNPAVSHAFTNGGVTTLTSTYLPIQSGVDHNIAEVVASGWEIDTSTGNAPSCTGSTLSGGNGSFNTATISNVEAAPDNQITCTFKNKLQRASVNVTKTGSDSGSQNGAVFTLYAGTGTGGTVVGTCTVSSGQCAPSSGPSSPSFPNLLPGTYTLDETSVPDGYTKPASLPATFGVIAGENKPFAITNAAQPGSAAITKLDDANNPVVGAVFTVYSPAGVDANGVPTGSSAGSCTTNASGTCTIPSLAAGTYTIDEVPPAGYAKDPSFPKTISITNGTATPVSATNPRLFKTIVIVCQQAGNKLYPSAITIDGASAGSSLSAAGATSAGLSESGLCGLTAGAKSDLRSANHASNPHSASINIPNAQP